MPSWVATVRETDPVAIAVVQMTPSHQVFGQVAALFDDYRAHYGQPPSPGSPTTGFTASWLSTG